MDNSKKKDLCEIFGYAPNDLTKKVRRLWVSGVCPFVQKKCTKFNSDKSIIYGTCSTSSSEGNVIICPKRLYAENFMVIRQVFEDAFDSSLPFYFFEDFVKEREEIEECVVALSQLSGREVSLRNDEKSSNQLSMDWVLVHFRGEELVEYVGIEVQSIDITGNYRDNWDAYKNLKKKETGDIPPSEHGYNWANVHKRLIPQLIRKGRVYSQSSFVKKGLYFIVPDEVYKRFEDVIGDDIPLLERPQVESLSIFTYQLGDAVSHGQQRSLLRKRTIRVHLDEFAKRFISGINLPSGKDLDSALIKLLGLTR